MHAISHFIGGVFQPVFHLIGWLLAFIYDNVVPNYAIAIALLTIIIMGVLTPFTVKSTRSMMAMQKLQPEIKKLQVKYKGPDNRQQLNEEMMKLYKEEGVNPIGGCLPMLIQIPFFISFYRVLLESVEMRQAPFLLWVNDLSSRDPFFVLPLLMGAAMFAQFKLNPPPPDPMQAKIMQFMPLIMTGMMAWFPCGLVLYWLTNTLLTIAQQWRVNQVVEIEAAKQRS